MPQDHVLWKAMVLAVLNLWVVLPETKLVDFYMNRSQFK